MLRLESMVIYLRGILDSSKSLRVALENSISAASMILLIDCTIIDDNISETKVEG